MALDKCIGPIEAAAGRKLTPEERKVVAAHGVRILNAARNGGNIKNLLDSYVDGMKAHAAISKRNAALNVSWLKEKKDFIKNNPAWQGDPADSMTALTYGSMTSKIRSKDSLSSKVTNHTEGAQAEFWSDIERAGLTRYLGSGADDKNLFMAISALQHGEDASKFGKAAAEAAAIYVKHNRLRLGEYNSVGGWIQENPDRVGRRTHDPDKIRSAGEPQWVADLRDLDWDKAFHGEYAAAEPSKRAALLSSQFQQLGNGYHLSFSPPEGGGKGFGSIGAKRAHSQEYIFKSPEADFTYQQKYGIGDNLGSRLSLDLASLGRDTAIMDHLGPNGLENLRKLKESWVKDLTAEGRGAEVEKLNKAFHSVETKLWPVVAGDPLAVHGRLERYSRSIKQFQGLSHLGSVVLRQIGDMTTRAQKLNYYGARNPGGWMGRQYNAVMHMAGAFTDKQARLDWAARQHILTDNIHRPLGYSTGLDLPGFGKAAKTERWMMKVGGSLGWLNRMRTSSAAELAHNHYNLRNTSYDQLGSGYRDTFKQYGIDSAGWDIIRKTSPAELGNGYKGLDASEILGLPRAQFRSLATMDNPTEYHLGKKQRDLYNSYVNILSDTGNVAVNHASPAIRALAYQGTHAGTVVGEGLRQAATFKLWTLSFMRNFLGTELHGYAEGRISTPRALARVLTLKDGGKGMVGLSTLLAGGVFWGHLSNMLGDLAKGETPQNPFEPQQASSALSRALYTSSSAGLYGDFLLGEGRSTADKAWDMFAGPALGSAGHAMDAAFMAYHGLSKDNTDEEEMKALDKLLRAGEEQLPFRNFVYTRGALDYLMFDPLSEALNPGWKQRKANRLAQSGQQLLLGNQ